MATFFTQKLLYWNDTDNDRPMPWKGEKDPYKIWLSEIILQQTRVEQGWSYYEKFIKAFPTVYDLAKAKEQKVFKLWEGLGYYNRCKNLLYTAKEIVQLHNGVFPSNYDALLKLKGVGPYTAAAIASFAFDLPYAVVDGNVFRVFARFYGIHTPTDCREGLAVFNEVAQKNLELRQPGLYNQALMDFGATVCKPLVPNCARCPLQSKCVAYSQGIVNQLPIKLKSIQRKKRQFDFFCFQYQKTWWVQKRGAGDIWQNLFQFYLVENTSMRPMTESYLKHILVQQLGMTKNHFDLGDMSAIQKSTSPVFRQTLTHQLLQARFVLVKLKQKPTLLNQGTWVTASTFKKLAFPKMINEFFLTQFKLWGHSE
jgi:A/G-specific adenine glycosylase